MLWLMFALSSAILVATHQMLIKKYVRNINEFVLSSGTTFIGAIIMLTISSVRGFPEIKPDFFPSLAVTASLNVIATIITYKALKKADLSRAMPMLAFTPAFLIVTSALILGERPTSFGIIGIALTITGSYVAAIEGDISAPFRKGVLPMLGVAFIYSITSNFDKKMLLASDVYFGAGMTLLLISTALFGCAVWHNQLGEFIKWKKTIVLLGIVLAMTSIASNTALTLQIVPYVIAVKRLSSIFVVLYGAFLFKEDHTSQRLAGASLMVLGVLVILLL